MPVCLAAAGAFGGCSGSNNPSGFDADGGGGGSDGANAGDDATSGDDVGSFGGGDAGDGAASLGCSPDLQHVIDQSGQVVKDCPPDQGCDGGQCVAACTAAGDSHGNVGCDFVVATPSFYAGIAPPCFAVFVANNWPHDAKIVVERGGTKYDVTQFGRIPDGTPKAANWQPVPSSGLPNGKVAVLFLSHDPSSVNGTPLTCPIPPAVSQAGGTAVYGGPGGQDTGRGQAWHISSDIPLSAYDILPYGGASSYLPSAELVLPTTAWGTNYVAMLPKPTSGPPWAQIVAVKSGTTVTIVPVQDLPSGPNVSGAAQNKVATYTLSAGEYVQWQWPWNQGGGSNPDITGTVIQSSAPVAFTGGTGYLCTAPSPNGIVSSTSQGGGCDSGHQMIPPVNALGSEYVAPPYATRMSSMQEESIPYRFVGAVKGTALTYEPPVSGAPTSLDEGQLVEFQATGPFVVKSQDDKHPFYVGQEMSGCEVQGYPNGSRPACSGSQGFGCCLGDEEFVNILPPAQWLSKYVFFTDPTYPTTNLVVVRMKTAAGFSDVKVDCLGSLSGWKPVGAGGKYQITNVDLIRGTPNGSCTNGGHVAQSQGPFGLMVWGLDQFSSYAYPAGGNVAPINQVVVPPQPK